MRPSIADYKMRRLEVAAESGDEIGFSMSAKAINWANRSAMDFERAIRLALRVGAHLIARKLSQLGVEQYPDHSELQKFAHVLAPPRVIDAHAHPDPNARADMEWLRTHGDEYCGQWVAIRGGQLLASASSMKELVYIIGNPKGTGVMVTRVY